MTFLTKEQEDIISFSNEDIERLIEIISKLPEIYTASIEEIQIARDKICENMNK